MFPAFIYLCCGAGLDCGELLVALCEPELVESDIEHDQELETSSGDRGLELETEHHYLDLFQLS